MTAREQRVLELRYSGKTFREIGEVIGVTPARVRQIFIKAQRKEGYARVAKLFIDWRVTYDYNMLKDIIDDIRGLAKDERQG